MREKVSGFLVPLAVTVTSTFDTVKVIPCGARKEVL